MTLLFPSDFLEEEEGVDLEEEFVNSNHRPVRRTKNTSMSDQLSNASLSTISSKEQTGRDYKGQILPQEHLYSHLKAKRNKRRIRERDHGRDKGYRIPQEDEERRMEKERQLRRSATEVNQETLTDRRKSIEEEEEEDEASVQAHVRRTLKWVKLSSIQQSNKIATLRLTKTFKNSQRSPLYMLASHILSNRAHPAPRENEVKSGKMYIAKPHPAKSTPKPPVEIFPGVFLYQTASGKKLVDFSSRWRLMKRRASWPTLDHKSSTQQLRHSSILAPTPQNVKDFPSSSITDFPPLSSELTATNSSDKQQSEETKVAQASDMVEESFKDGTASEYSYEDEEPQLGWTEEAINWQRTFSVNPVDFELLRSDWNDLRCNVSGNLQLAESEALEVISQYVERINKCNRG